MRRYILLFIFVLFFCFTANVEARKLALLVGVDKYDNIQSLECCVNDMKTLKEALMKIGFKENDIQILVTDASYSRDLPTKRNIEWNISRILDKVQSDDMVFLAFSGHGMQENQNVYFCPRDVDVDNLAGTCVSINKIMDDLANCHAQFKLMVVDACRDDPTRGTKGFASKGLQVIPTPPAGIALFQSCSKGEKSYEDVDNGNGFFTKNFAAALSGEADSDNDGNLTLLEVFKWTTEKTKEQVKDSRNKIQSPFFNASFSDFTLSEDLNVKKAHALEEEARKAMDNKNYELAVKKYDEAIALCPRHSWKRALIRERDSAQSFLNARPRFNPMNVTVPNDFPTIEEAYANVKDGGIITIQPGKYELSKTFVVDRPVTFRGNSGRVEDVVIDCPSADAFKITGGSPSFQYLTVISGADACNAFYVTGGAPKLFRCIITSYKASGIAIEGEKSNPKVESCTIKNCGGNGVQVVNYGLGVFNYCEIYGNGMPGISVKTFGNSTFTGCKIHDGKANGVYVLENGRGLFINCEIYRNALPGIVVQTSGNPTVTGCKIHDGKNCGVYVFDKGMGTFNKNILERNYLNGVLDNWHIDTDAGVVKGSGNAPPIPVR